MSDDNSALYAQLEATIRAMADACDIAMADQSPVTLAAGARVKKRRPAVTGVTLVRDEDAENLTFKLQLRGDNAAVCTRPICDLVVKCGATDAGRSMLSNAAKGDNSDRQLDFKIPKKDSAQFLTRLQDFDRHVTKTVDQFKTLVQTASHIEQACNGTNLDPAGEPLCAKFFYGLTWTKQSVTGSAWVVKVRTGNKALADALGQLGLKIVPGDNEQHRTSDGQRKFYDKWIATKTLLPGDQLNFIEVKRATTGLHGPLALGDGKPGSGPRGDDDKPPTLGGGHFPLAKRLLDHGARGFC